MKKKAVGYPKGIGPTPGGGFTVGDVIKIMAVDGVQVTGSFKVTGATYDVGVDYGDGASATARCRKAMRNDDRVRVVRDGCKHLMRLNLTPAIRQVEEGDVEPVSPEDEELFVRAGVPVEKWHQVIRARRRLTASPRPARASASKSSARLAVGVGAGELGVSGSVEFYYENDELLGQALGCPNLKISRR